MLWAIESKPFVADSDPEKTKILVLLNPFGGAGAAPRNWAIAQPLFQLAHVDYEVIMTQHAGHAGEIVHE